MTRSFALMSDWRLPSPCSTPISINTSSTIAMVYYPYQHCRNSPDVTYHSEKYQTLLELGDLRKRMSIGPEPYDGRQYHDTHQNVAGYNDVWSMIISRELGASLKH